MDSASVLMVVYRNASNVNTYVRRLVLVQSSLRILRDIIPVYILALINKRHEIIMDIKAKSKNQDQEHKSFIASSKV